MWIKRLAAYNRGVVMDADGAGAGGGGDPAPVLGENADASVLFPGDAAAADAKPGDAKDAKPEGAADWKEYQDDPAKSADENAAAKAAHDATKPKDEKTDPAADKVPDDGKYDLKMPDGVDLDKELADALSPDFKELGLTNAQAQKLVDKYIQTQQARMEGHANSPVGILAMTMSEYFKEAGTPDQWREQAEKDKTIGGANWDRTTANALRFVKHVNDPSLVKYLNASGGGNHPAVISAFAKAGALIREDDPASGGSGGTGKPAEASYLLFPSDAPKG